MQINNSLYRELLKIFSIKSLRDSLLKGVSAVTSFLKLSDTPSSFSGQSGKYTRVNSAEDGIEFGSPAGGVSSVFTRSGDVVAATGDYSHSQLSAIGTDDHHAEVHGLADSAKHTGIAGPALNIMVINTNGLPEDGGKNISEVGNPIRTWTQNSVLNDFSRWTLTDTALNANNEIQLAAI